MLRIKKSPQLEGNHLVLRDVTVADVSFIYGLRTDPKLAKYLSVVSDDLQAQVRWLNQYAEDDRQAYFVVLDRERTLQPIGTVRLYGARDDAFSWGSWLLRPGLPARYAVESAMMVYHYAVWLGFRRAYFEVRQENTSVWRFHERFGAQRVGSEHQHYQYELSESAMRSGMAAYQRYLPNGIRVTV